MRKELLILVTGTSLILASPFAMAAKAAAAVADKTAKQAIVVEKTAENTPVAVSKILENLKAKGYVGLREVELDDNVYKADVVTAEGEALDVKVNATTGEVMSPKATPNHLSIVDVAKKVEEAGYRITKIKAEGEAYKVRALDKDGKKAALKVNAMTGEISKKWFD